MELALEMGRGAGKVAQIGAPTLATAMEVYLARPKLRSDTYKHGVRAYMDNQLKDWLRLPLGRDQQVHGCPAARATGREPFNREPRSAIFRDRLESCEANPRFSGSPRWRSNGTRRSPMAGSLMT